MKLREYLSGDCVVFISEAKNKDEVLEKLIEAAGAAGKVESIYRFAEAVGARELIMSTGIGLGVAVPHAKMKNIDRFFLVIGILGTGVEWDSIDASPVRLVFLIGGPENDQNGYLGILSRVVSLAKNSGRKNKLLGAESPESVMAIMDNV